MTASRTQSAKPVIGWREWVALPDLGVSAIKAKIDTGARSSSLHAYNIERFTRGDQDRVRFTVHPYQRDIATTRVAEATLLAERWVRSSSGRQELRAVVETTLELMGQRWTIELTLSNRDQMGFRMLLGRQAVRRRFVVDPGRSYRAGRPPVDSASPTRKPR
ncbi:MAG TPA: RimK/LysX family protein [Actinomycetota bacterium]